MENLKKEVEQMKIRTPFDATVKKALILLLGKTGFVELEQPVDANNKDVLIEYARENGVEVPEPQNKPDYVKAIESHLGIESDEDETETDSE